MTAHALLANPDLNGDAVTEAVFPEGVFSLPVGFLVLHSDSALAALVRARCALGDRPFEYAKVFLHRGMAFAVVDYPGRFHPSVFFSLRLTGEDLEEWRPARPFGRREPRP